MKNSDRLALYPGSFDPLTFGHIDLIKRACELFDEVHVAVARNMEKAALFSLEDRLAFIREALGSKKHVHIDAFDGLVVDYAAKHGIRTIIRGVRATSDFDYEFQMAMTNRHLNKRIDTVFLMPSEKYFYLSSRLIKEVARLGGNVSHFVPLRVSKALKKRLLKKRR